MITKETVKLYLDLYSLLDTRQGILANFYNSEELATYVNSEEYVFRTTDIFNVDMVKYKEFESKRDKVIISNSTISYMFSILKNKIVNLEKRNISQGNNKAPEILLNIYPFILTEKEANDIVDILFKKLDTNVFISIINAPANEISPLFLKTNEIVAAYIYNSHEWLEANLKAVYDTKIHDTVIHFPSLTYNEVTDEQNKQITKLGFSDIFSYTEYLLSGYMLVNFLPIIFYSNILTASGYISKYNFDNKDKSLKEMTTESGG